MSETVNIWKTQRRNYVNGPGCRFVVWVQGCHLACPGCWNQHTWSFDKKNLMSVDSLYAEIASVRGLDGLTLTGGEPFVQAKNLIPLVARVKRELQLNLQIFTGFELSELRKKYQQQLLALADVVVAGRFDASKQNNNQKVYEMADVRWPFNNTDVEIEIDQEGALLLTGYPTNELIQDIKEIVA